jgi:hypothetical protein
MTTTLQQLTASQANKEVAVNRNFETLSALGVYGKKQSTSTGLTWGYYGGRWGGFSVADGTHTLTNTTDNYIVAKRSDGVTSVSTATTNWNNTADYARVYKVTTAGSVVTATEDHRAGLYGALGIAVSPGAVGTVTSVAASVPAFLSVAGSPITTAGTLAISYSGTALPVANGGTGVTTLTAYAPVFGGTTGTGAVQSGTVGSAGQVLTSNGAGALPTFQAAASGSVATDTIWDAAGDLVQGTGSNTAARLAIGTAGQVLKVNAGATAVEWGAAAGDVATDAIWDAAGDLAVGSGANTAAKLSKGTALQVLRVNAGETALEWATPSGGSTQGRHAVFIAAGSMAPSVSGGCAVLSRIASAADQPDIVSLNFDPTTQEYAQFSLVMPKSWDEGTVTFAPVWSHAATTTNFGVVWDLQGYAASNDDAIATAFGTAQTSTDTGGTTNDIYMGPESAAITIAGTPASEDTVFFRLSRVTGNGSDTMAIDARLHGIVLYITTNADTDA